MNTKSAKKALKQIAKREGVSIKAVRREIEFAINEARNNPDPKIQAIWKAMPCKGEFPTPEELITHIVDNINRSD